MQCEMRAFLCARTSLCAASERTQILHQCVRANTLRTRVHRIANANFAHIYVCVCVLKLNEKR